MTAGLPTQWYVVDNELLHVNGPCAYDLCVHLQKQDRDGWPKYLGTLEYEVALIGNRPLAVGSNVSFAVQEDNSMGAHLVARHPDTGVVRYTLA